MRRLTKAQQALAASNLIFTVGSGMYLTAGVLYFTEAAHLPNGQVGLGLLIAGLVALLLGVGVGHLADRHGARRVYTVTLIVQAVATAAFLLAYDFWPFVAIVSLATGSKAAGVAARSPLIRRYGGERPQEFRAYLRAVTNVGISFGALGAGWAVQVGTTSAYSTMIWAIALLTLASAAFLAFVPTVDPAPATGSRRWIALRDRPYLLLTALDGVMAIQFKVLTVAVPLWIVGATTAPRWLISATMLTGTVMVVVFQVRASRGVDSPAAGALAYRRAGFAFLAACALIPLTAGMSPLGASMLLLAAIVVHTVGELWHAAAGFEVSFALAPEHATGQYLGVFGLGAGLAEAVGPGLLIWLCIEWGRPGWYIVGALFALSGVAAPVVVWWASRVAQSTRHPRESDGARRVAPVTRRPRESDGHVALRR
ncbi:MFS transporter [Actinoplanes sp. LDG1-06]|uniref:MFS transporter n=1 Tax=Paractinoplanes ovalisporus TaxID=2810368 RepID=A0ABS2ALV5_9ACTN|nr:MFS transporter [Actinoplanes ovalisporus]MBM2620847.1 MFS transporter [Actinoplanes ovalisporus]